MLISRKKKKKKNATEHMWAFCDYIARCWQFYRISDDFLSNLLILVETGNILNISKQIDVFNLEHKIWWM